MHLNLIDVTEFCRKSNIDIAETSTLIAFDTETGKILVTDDVNVVFDSTKIVVISASRLPSGIVVTLQKIDGVEISDSLHAKIGIAMSYALRKSPQLATVALAWLATGLIETYETFVYQRDLSAVHTAHSLGRVMIQFTSNYDMITVAFDNRIFDADVFDVDQSVTGKDMIAIGKLADNSDNVVQFDNQVVLFRPGVGMHWLLFSEGIETAYDNKGAPINRLDTYMDDEKKDHTSTRVLAWAAIDVDGNIEPNKLTRLCISDQKVEVMAGIHITDVEGTTNPFYQAFAGKTQPSVNV